MARSRRHTPITGYTSALSEAEDKRDCARRLRRCDRQRIRIQDPEEILDPEKFEYGDPWDFAKDGKFYFLKCKWRHPEWQDYEWVESLWRK